MAQFSGAQDQSIASRASRGASPVEVFERAGVIVIWNKLALVRTIGVHQY
jgi:hypothetical protein